MKNIKIIQNDRKILYNRQVSKCFQALLFLVLHRDHCRGSYVKEYIFKQRFEFN